MQIITSGAQKRPENATYHQLIGRDILPQKSSGLLSRDNLRRLVATMVD